MSEPSHYEVLGIPDTAGPDEVRAAYRARARALHPDRAGEAGAAAMAQLNEAYRTLRDPERRRQYDGSRRAGDRSGSAAGGASTATAGPQWTPAAPPPVHKGAGCMVGALLAAVLLVGVVVGVLIASNSGGGPDAVDGVVGIGSCLAVAGDGSLREVSCDGPHEAVVVDVVAPDQTCPPGTRTVASAGSAARLCVV